MIKVYFLFWILYTIIKNDDCAIKENKPIWKILDTGVNINGISHKYISELEITYHSENNSIKTLNASYFTLEKVNLCITFNDDKKHKSISSEFIIVRSD